MLARRARESFQKRTQADSARLPSGTQPITPRIVLCLGSARAGARPSDPWFAPPVRASLALASASILRFLRPVLLRVNRALIRGGRFKGQRNLCFLGRPGPRGAQTRPEMKAPGPQDIVGVSEEVIGFRNRGGGPVGHPQGVQCLFSIQNASQMTTTNGVLRGF